MRTIVSGSCDRALQRALITCKSSNMIIRIFEHLSHLGMRLRQDPPLRKAYSSLKEDLARKHRSERNAYSNAKTEFVQSVLEAAGVGLSSRTPV